MYIVYQSKIGSTTGNLLNLPAKKATLLEQKCIALGLIVNKNRDLGKAILGFGEKVEKEAAFSPELSEN